MKKLVVALCAVITLGVVAPACSYSGMAVVSDGRVLVARNDGFLFGALRTIYICDVEEDGLANCVPSAESP
jgi:hypothetical protein